METKALTLEKIEDEGAIVALFSRFGVVDSDGDITVASAFEDGQQVPIGGWNHAYQALPTGKGTIVVNEDAARLDGQLFMDTDHGRAMFGTLKGLGSLAEWSYVFEVKEWEVQQTEDGSSVRILKKLDPWSVDPVTRGAGVGTMTEIVKSLGPSRFADQAESVLIAVDAFVARARSLADYRAKEGRVLSSVNRQRLENLASQMSEAITAVTALLAETDPNGGDDSEKAAQARLVHLGSLRARLRAAELGAASITGAI